MKAKTITKDPGKMNDWEVTPTYVWCSYCATEEMIKWWEMQVWMIKWKMICNKCYEKAIELLIEFKNK